MKKVVILGSTGSIGTQTIEIINKNPERFKVAGLSAGSNWKLLARQTWMLRPRAVALEDESRLLDFKKAVRGLKVEVLSGKDGLLSLVDQSGADIFMVAIVGIAGLVPTIKAIKKKVRIALANKETMVVAGNLVMKLIKENQAEIIPVDSEHSAIFQCLRAQESKYLSKIILTSSGGPFKNYPKKKLASLTAKDALKHPTWKMGKKITIDSATLMNKGFEVIEAKWLFGVNLDKIKVVVHPQSVIHSLVEFKDGSVLAQLALPDMRLPISYALFYPQRAELNFSKLSLEKSSPLTFMKPDIKLFPCLGIAYEAARLGGSSPVVLNAANEAAVELFLKNKIGFLDIPGIIKKELKAHRFIKSPGLEEILSLDRKVRQRINGAHN